MLRDERMALPALLGYAQYGAPLAMAALPLYVHLPQFYAATLGVPLAWLGAVLLALRLFDAVIDPLLGVWSDGHASRKRLVMAAAPALALGMLALFLPPAFSAVGLLVWMALALFVVYTAFSLATINIGAWGAELSGDPVERTRITATREGLGLLGVVVASVAPSLLAGGDEVLGLQRFAWAFVALLLLCTAWLWRRAPEARRAAATTLPLRGSIAAVMRDRRFRALLLVFVLNGIAAAIPATLLLFFVSDVLQASRYQGLFLALYFIAGACGMPLWVRLSARIGKVRAWQSAMVASVIAFVWATLLGAGDISAFAVVCVLSGLALGADLALPPSLLADVIGDGAQRSVTGTYFGVWTLATKLNLALAAGIALPLVAALGYAPATHDSDALTALAFVYAGVPSLLKLAAAVSLAWFARQMRTSATVPA